MLCCCSLGEISSMVALKLMQLRVLKIIERASTTFTRFVFMPLDVASIRVHLEIYRVEMHALCAPQTLTAWMLRPHVKRINI